MAVAKQDKKTLFIFEIKKILKSILGNLCLDNFFFFFYDLENKKELIATFLSGVRNKFNKKDIIITWDLYKMHFQTRE